MERTARERRTGAMSRDGRWQGGFTLVETIAVVGLLIVLFGVAFAGVINIWRSMRQLEMDGTAKEIYVAAQNHLSLAESQGLLDLQQGGTYTFARGALEPSASAKDSDAVHYFMVLGSTIANDASIANPNNKGSALSLMLPVGSIDDTVRRGGSYLVRYQPSTATVLDVFYTKEGNLSDGTDADNDSKYAALMGTVSPTDNRLARRSFAAYDKAGEPKGITVGYYGGEGAKEAPAKLKAPTIEVVNAERLLVRLTNPAVNDARIAAYNEGKADDKRLTLQLRVIVEGEQSGAAAAFAVGEDGDAPDDDGAYTVVLDDVTAEGGSFARSVASENANAFIPGENLRIFAWATSSTGRATVATSAAAKTNSLFATGETTYDEATLAVGYQVEIDNMRHLLNLDPRVSSFDPSNERLGQEDTLSHVWRQATSVAALQMSDLSWPGFKTKIDDGADPSVYYLPGDRAGTTQVPTAEGQYLPVNPTYVLAYDGRAHRIKGVSVAGADGAPAAGNAGLFGSLATNGSSVGNLELVGFDIVADGSAGALAGELGAGVTATNVLARNALSKTGGTTHSKRIAGDAAGGLVGDLKGGLASSAAAVYVEGTTAAGGLVGAATAATVADSYAGGHTKDGSYTTLTTGAAHLNVRATDAAGGLVGSATNTRIDRCYATCSAQAGDSGAVGGLVGNASGGRIDGSYAVGLIDGGAGDQRGAFVGVLAGTTLGTGDDANRFLEIVNGSGVAPVGSDATDTAVAAIDADLSSYNDFVQPVGDTKDAIPYDRFLATQYGGAFPLRTIAGLDAAKASELAALPADHKYLTTHLSRHYGDWPVVETFVENVRSGAGGPTPPGP